MATREPKPSEAQPTVRLADSILSRPTAAMPPFNVEGEGFEPVGATVPPRYTPGRRGGDAPINSLDLEDLPLEVNLDAEVQLKSLLHDRVRAIGAVYDTIHVLGNDLTEFKPLVPETLPTEITGKLVNPDGSAAAGVRVQAIEPTGPISVDKPNAKPFAMVLSWPNPETMTDARGAFRMALPPRPLPDAGLQLSVIGANRTTDLQLRRIDLVAGAGNVGILPLDDAVLPLPRSVVARVGELVVRPTDDMDVLNHPGEFADPAPQITLGSSDCAVNFQSNSGVIDTFNYSMMVRLVAPDLSARRLGTRVPGGGARVERGNKGVLLSATRAGLSKYFSPGDLIAHMEAMGTWELVSRVPVEAPIDVANWLDDVERNPRAVPKAATLGLGYVVKMHQIWIPSGLSLGDLVYSLPLAPGEQQRIAISEERESLSVREMESMTSEEQQRYNENVDSSTDAVFRSAFDEAASGGSRSKTRTESGSVGGGVGVNLGFVSIGASGGYSDSTTTGSTSSWQNASRDYVSSASQDFHSSLARSASARRRASRTSVRLANSSERKEIVTKVITNHNHNHALTMQYWQVLRHFAVSSKVDDVQLVCYVPFELVQWLPAGQSRVLPTGAYQRDFLLARYAELVNHHDVLMSRLRWNGKFKYALDQLMSFVGNPTMTAEGSAGDPQSIVNVSIAGTFLPFEDVWVTAISTNGERIGPVRMVGVSSQVATGAQTKAELLTKLLDRRQGTPSETKTAAITLPRHVGRAHLARLEFSRAFRQFTYALAAPPQPDSISDIFAYLEQLKHLDVTLSPDELERELSGPIVFDPTARIDAGTNLLEAFNGSGGTDIMPIVMPVAAKWIPPELSFADLLRIESLFQHVVESTIEYSKAVWQSLTPEERAIMLEQYTIGVPTGGAADATDEVPLLDCVANQVLGYFGNAAIMPFFIPAPLAKRIKYTSRDMQESLLRFHRQAYHPATTSITLPARGVLGEAVLGHCESSEKVDLTRFWNWQDSPADQATDPAALAALLGGGNALIGSGGAQAPNTVGQGGSMVTINQGATAMQPADLAAALIKGMPATNLPQDLTGIKELGAQMKVQTETTAAGLNKTIEQASGLAKEAMKQLPEFLKAVKGEGGESASGSGSTGSGSTGSGSTGSGSTGSGSTGGGSTGGGDAAPIDGGAAPA